MRGTFSPFNHFSPTFSPTSRQYATRDYRTLVRRVKSELYNSSPDSPTAYPRRTFETLNSPFSPNRRTAMTDMRIGMVKSLVKCGEKGEVPPSLWA